MSLEHRVDDVNEGFITRKAAVSPREQVGFEPSLTLVLAENFHHAAVRRQMIVFRQDLRDVAAVRHIKDILTTVGIVLVGTEKAEIPGIEIQLRHVAEKLPLNARGFRADGAGNLDGMPVQCC